MSFQEPTAQIITTAKNTPLRLTEMEPVPLQPRPDHSGPVIEVDLAGRAQTILGFGGAFTEAMAHALTRVSAARRREALEAYFHPQNGIGYSFCRTHINSCDFALGNYSYCDHPGTGDLADFSIRRDEATLIPLIRQAEAMRGAPLRLLASPWSPPAWMKTTGQMNGGGKLKPEYRATWAQYIARYVKAYADRGVQIWGVTPQNEPLAVTRWENCVYTHAEERELVKALAGAFRTADLEVKIVVWDHNKDCIKERVDIMFADLEAYEAAWGIGFHWYATADHDGAIDNGALEYLHRCYPDRALLATEGCNPAGRPDGMDALVWAWWPGEKYARHIIADLNHWTTAWIDWNMVLDERGGPNHAGNYCDAPILADTAHDRLIYETPFFYIGHFSRYIRPGATRLFSQVRGCNLQAVAAQNPDGEVVLVVLNEEDNPRFALALLDRHTVDVAMPPHSIRTFLIRR